MCQLASWLLTGLVWSMPGVMSAHAPAAAVSPNSQYVWWAADEGAGPAAHVSESQV